MSADTEMKGQFELSIALSVSETSPCHCKGLRRIKEGIIRRTAPLLASGQSF